MRIAAAILLSALCATITVSAHATDAGPANHPGLTTPAFDGSAKYRAVHIDTLDPKLQHVFEDARANWLKVLIEHHTTDGRGYFLQRDGSTLITLRSFNSFTEYDALRAFRADVGARIGPDGDKAGQLYDAGDVAITSPHNSEVWLRLDALDYRAPGTALNEYTAGYMRMVVEQVHSDAYEAAWKEIRAALATAKYPIGRISFFSMLGSGRQISLWLASDRAAFQAAGSPQAAVAKVLGEKKSEALFAQLAAACSSVQGSELIPRPELKSPE
jgi:hypothetical protein